MKGDIIMENAKKWLTGMSWLYIVRAVLSLIFMAIIMSNAEALQAIAAQVKGVDPKIYVAIAAILSIVFYFWYFWLIRRVINDKSKGTLLIVLLILGIIGAIASFATGQGNLGFIDICLDIVTIVSLIIINTQK